MLVTVLASCMQAHPSPNVHEPTNDLATRVEAYIQTVQDRYGIPGMALAIVHGGDPVYTGYHGYANLEHQVPVTDASIFRLYSLTKVMVSVGIFKLVEDGRLDLDASIATYLPAVPEAWRAVQIRHLLAHASGLPDMVGRTPLELRDLTDDEAIARVFSLPLSTAPGERFAYNQTNFWLLKTLIETVTEQSLDDFIIETQFLEASTDHVFFSTDARDIILNRVTPYFPFAKGTLTIDHPYVAGSHMDAASGLHLRLDDLIQWDERFRANTLISEASKQAMWAPFAYSHSDDLFTHSGNRIDFQGGHGYGFSGSLSTIYYIFPDEDLSVMVLTNGLSDFYDMKAMVLDLAAIATE
ncbi:MAG: hypothetical protein RhofKO_16030 [Rhodothermales bacterium]